MRVEATPFVYRNAERRQRFEDRRTATEDRRSEPQQPSSRARHEAHVWFAPAFGAHILGQVAPAKVNTTAAARAYTQPESRTPLRPSLNKSA